MDGSSYAYDGAGSRIQQTVGVNVTQYLLDLQPGLAVVLAETTGTNTNRYVHGPMGIHAQEDNSGSWTWPLQDGLGSVRGLVNDSLAVQGARHFAPYGTDFGQQGSIDMPYGFTGEQTDDNGQVYLRARYYNPTIGAFMAFDPLEFLNRYNYVNGNPINLVDRNGLCPSPNEDSLLQITSACQCEQLRTELQSWGIQVEYDKTSLPLCGLDDQVLRRLYFEETNLRWTLDEMSSLHAAFSIYRAALTVLGVSFTPSVQFVKRAYIQGHECSVGQRTGSTITLSEREWGEHATQYTGRCSSPYLQANLDDQSRSWWVLHEFSHYLQDELLKIQFPSAWEFERDALISELGTLFQTWPTEYSYSADSSARGQEQLTEAVAATLWENGYMAVSRYSRDAGGWTGGATTTTANGNILTNVSNISSTVATAFNWTLEDWIKCKVLNPSLCS